MRLIHFREQFLLIAVVLVGLSGSLGDSRAAPPGKDALMRAMEDELQRSMASLVLEDLPRPYFMQYRAVERKIYSLSAANGGLQEIDTRRTRRFASRIRVGSHELDNTNVGRRTGATGTLPLDDDYAALRHAIWRVTDRDYKQAVETLTRKTAYLKSRTVEDRPADFSPREGAVLIKPMVHMDLDEAEWGRRLKKLSARITRFKDIQNSSVTLFAGSENRWIVNSEGTRLRDGDTGIYLQIDVQLQADEGMYLFDSLSYLAEHPDGLPPMEEIEKDIGKLCEQMRALRSAEILEHYAGPVLFEAKAAGQVFRTLLAHGICARPLPLGARRADNRSFEKKIDRRVLPRSFQVFDDPLKKTFNDELLAGSYEIDDEAVAGTRVSVVEDGILKRMLASRVPTKTSTKSTGHARSNGLGDARAHVGCLYISTDNGLSSKELTKELIDAADEEGLDFALRIESMQGGGAAAAVLGSPIRAFKVFVDDGREELVRGLSFLPAPTRSLKHILAGGKDAEVHNAIGGIGSSVISPAVLFEELELTRSTEEYDKPPILRSPSNRESAN